MKNLNESKTRMKVLKHYLDAFEKTPECARYKMLVSMSKLDKDALWKEWDEYYRSVRASKIGLLMEAQKQSFKKGDFGRVQEIARMINETPGVLSDAPKKPVLPDPYETMHNSSEYVSKKNEYESLLRVFSIVGDGRDDEIL